MVVNSPRKPLIYLVSRDSGKSILLPKPATQGGPTINPASPYNTPSNGEPEDNLRDRGSDLGETVLSIALGDGKKAQIRFPLEITAKQIDKIIKTIEAQRPDDGN